MKMEQIGTKWLFYLYAALFLTIPWSPDVAGGSWHIRLPSEILTLATGMALAYGLFRHPEWLQQVQGNLWLRWAALAWMTWLTITLLCSTMPVVSLKYWLVETGHWWVFFGGFVLFPGWWRRLLPFFVCSMAGIVLFTLAHHFQYNFRADQSMLAPMPFFPDHTLYSAVLVMILPSLFLLFKRRVAGILLILYLTGLFFAHCRAAWMSVGASFLLALPLVFPKYRTWFWVLAAALLTAAIPLKTAVLGKVKQDVSMLERFNRYACALRMAQERPFTGFGPGTFQFQYVRFQKPEEMTRISISDPARDLQPDQYGRGGGAHSEYFQALAENGWPGLMIWLLLVGMSLFTGFICSGRCWRPRQQQGSDRSDMSALIPPFVVGGDANNGQRDSQTKGHQWIALAVTISLFSYFFHAGFNNFLHDGRVALLFWGQMAALIRE